MTSDTRQQYDEMYRALRVLHRKGQTTRAVAEFDRFSAFHDPHIIRAARRSLRARQAAAHSNGTPITVNSFTGEWVNHANARQHIYPRKENATMTAKLSKAQEALLIRAYDWEARNAKLNRTNFDVFDGLTYDDSVVVGSRKSADLLVSRYGFFSYEKHWYSLTDAGRDKARELLGETVEGEPDTPPQLENKTTVGQTVTDDDDFTRLNDRARELQCSVALVRYIESLEHRLDKLEQEDK